jgi:hypothetical protein
MRCSFHELCTLMQCNTMNYSIIYDLGLHIFVTFCKVFECSHQLHVNNKSCRSDVVKLL